MGAICAAAGDERHAAFARAAEPAEQIGRRAAGGMIVQADIGLAGRMDHVGDDGDQPGSRRTYLLCRLAHQRMVDRHEGDPVGPFGMELQRRRYGRGIEAFDKKAAHGAGVSPVRLRHVPNLLAQQLEIGITAHWQEEGDMGRARGGQKVALLPAEIAEVHSSRQNALDRPRLHPLATVHHAVDRCQRNAGGGGDVVQGWIRRSDHVHLKSPQFLPFDLRLSVSYRNVKRSR